MCFNHFINLMYDEKQSHSMGCSGSGDFYFIMLFWDGIDAIYRILG